MSKLIKYEFKKSKKQFIHLTLILMVISFIIQGLTSAFISYSSSVGSGYANVGGSIFFVIFALAFPVLFIILLFSTMTYYFSLGTILKKDIYDDQAYLTLSLPHSGREIIGAKMVVGFVWSLVIPIIVGLLNLALLYINGAIVYSIIMGNPIKESIEVISNAFNIQYLINMIKESSLQSVIIAITAILTNALMMVSIIFASVVIAYRLGSRSKNSIVWVLISLVAFLLWGYLADVILNIINSTPSTDYPSLYGNLTSLTNRFAVIVLNILTAFGLYMYTANSYDSKIEI